MSLLFVSVFGMEKDLFVKFYCHNVIVFSIVSVDTCDEQYFTV